MFEVIGYRQMEINQLETPKPQVARFEWELRDQGDNVVVRGQIIVIGERVELAGWKPATEYWYVTALGAGGAPVRTMLECKEMVSADSAQTLLSKLSPSAAFVAPMVPQPAKLGAEDPVLRQPRLQGHFRTLGTDGTVTEAALWIELDGARLARVDWYWTGTRPLSLFPGGAKVGDRVELKEVRCGESGFPTPSWNRHQSVAALAVT